MCFVTAEPADKKLLMMQEISAHLPHSGASVSLVPKTVVIPLHTFFNQMQVSRLHLIKHSSTERYPKSKQLNIFWRQISYHISVLQGHKRSDCAYKGRDKMLRNE
jgi:hypothetical protein